MKRRLIESMGLLMIGDGIATLLMPKRHCMLWEVGPETTRNAVDELVQHPRLAQALGLLEAVAGFWIASHQMPEDTVTERMTFRRSPFAFAGR